MTRGTGWLILFFTGCGSAMAADETTTLVLVWQDPQRLVPRFDPARAEAERIFTSLGARVRWEVGSDPSERSSDVRRIQVVLMPSEPSSWKLPSSALGVVLLPDRTPQDRLFLFYPAILRGLGIDGARGRMLEPREEKRVALALGRVVVHEVIHAVVPTLGHAKEGIMHDALTSSALSRRAAQLDERSRIAFLKALASPKASSVRVADSSRE
jgi:hypothetical protein